MGLIDRAKDDQFTLLLEQGEADATRAVHELDLERQRIVIVTEKLELVATKLGEPLEPITQTPIGLPRYYRLGDIVIMVQKFTYGPAKTDPKVPHLVAMSYCTYLVALGPDKSLHHLKVGTLKFMDYAGIAKTITSAPSDFEFHAQAVKLYIP